MPFYPALRPYFKDRAVLVYGLGGSGGAVARAILAAGLKVYVGDDKPQAVVPLTELGAIPFLSPHPLPNDCGTVILNPGIPLTHPEPHPVVRAAQTLGLTIIGDIEVFGTIYPGPTVGITGTNGKSTTTALITHILNNTGRPAMAAGNIGEPVFNINPDERKQAILELSSFQLDLCPTFRPTYAVHMNITPDHLDRHGTLENYIAVKERIFEGTGWGFCGVDDPASQGIMARALSKGTRHMIAVSNQHQVKDGLGIEQNHLVDLTFPDPPIIDFSTLPTLRGRHNWQNALMAYGVARALGVFGADILQGLMTYPGLPHRQQLIRTMNKVEYVNDSKATNADATEKALMTYDTIYWLVGGRPKAGGLKGLEPYAAKVKHAYLIGESAPDFALFMRANNIPYTISHILDQALTAAHQDAQATAKPATILLSPACASFDQFRSYEHRGDVFIQLVQKLRAP